MNTLSCAPLRVLQAGSLGLRGLAVRGWPRARFTSADGVHISLRSMAVQLSAACVGLQGFAHDTASHWPLLDRAQIGAGLAQRVLNPTVIYQASTELCGPTAITFELARRHPDRYVDLARQLLGTGQAKLPNGRVISPGDGVRHEAATAGVAQADRLIIAALRDDDNSFIPVGSGTSGLEGMTPPGEMLGWCKDVLGFPEADDDRCWSTGEANSFRYQHPVPHRERRLGC